MNNKEKRSNGSNGVHPIADLFPMLAGDELAELAADIKERGLLHPIVKDKDGRVLDGRNRMAACKLAGIEPQYSVYDGDDPDGYALAVNIARRHLTMGQRAITVARALDILGISQREAAKRYKLYHSRISQAVTVLQCAPELADPVASGATPLDEAYKTARERKEAAESTETKLAWLGERDAGLVSKVVEGELTLAGAVAEWNEREAQRQSQLRAARANLNSVLLHLSSESSIKPAELAQKSFADIISEFDAEQIEYAAKTMAAIAQLAKEKR